MSRLRLLALAASLAGAWSCEGGLVADDGDAAVKADASSPAPDASQAPDAGEAAFDASGAGEDASPLAGADARLPASDAAQPAPDAAPPGLDAAQPGPDAGPLAGRDASAPEVDDAVVVSSSFPSTLGCGGTFSATVEVKNTGTSTWAFPDFKLGAVDDSDPFYGPDTRVWLPSGASVAPGETWTFTLPMTAPASPGARATDWRMVHEGVRWFGATASATVAVACVDPSTLTGKLMMGYQGWFFCPGDGSPYNSWVHWFGGSGQPTVDLWPDTRELDSDELCATSYTLPSGAPAHLYSAWNAKTVARHFKWMADHHLDGVMLQRFTLGLHDSTNKAALDKVAQNVRAGAEAHGRVFNVMYDISGHNPSSMLGDLEADWTYLVKTMGITSSPRYLHHKGRPLVSVWGFSFANRPGTTAELASLVDFFHNNADPDLRATVMGGVHREWRDDATWAGPVRAFDVISPWSVGSYRTDADIDAYKPRIVADLADCQSHGIDFMPVVWPGFSWFNLKGDPANAFPRRGGAHYWRQVYNAVSAGVPTIYGAMFDEVDEGTAMFKVAETAADQPTQAPFVPLNVDGYSLPSSWYLQLADQAGRMLRKEIPLSSTMPITP